MRKIQFINNEYYHIYNRGVEKRNIFLDKNDYFRFIHNLFEFNDIVPAGKFSQPSESRPPNIPERKPIVEIICFSLMPNHFHLILRQLVINGISLFMQKLGGGYAMYFNQKYARVGGLFQGRFKAVPVNNEDYLTHLSRYIHLNPVELIEPNWETGGIKNWEEANKFLESYRWSSYPDYLGKANFPSITNRDFLLRIFNGSENYKRFVNGWMIKDLDKIKILLPDFKLSEVGTPKVG